MLPDQDASNVMRSIRLFQSACIVLQALLLCSDVFAAEKVTLTPHTFTIPEGYVLKRVAAPPLVQRPIHMCFDEKGVLYVTDSSGNSDKAPAQLKDPSHRVLRLIDRDGDGDDGGVGAAGRWSPNERGRELVFRPPFSALRFMNTTTAARRVARLPVLPAG